MKIAQAAKMMASAQRDFLLAQQMKEDSEAKTKDYEAMRQKVYRLERSVAATRGDVSHGKTTRRSKDASSTDAEVWAAASKFLNCVAEDAGSYGEGVTPLEVLKRTTIQVPLEVNRKPEAAALIRLLKALSADHLTGNQIVLLVAALFPVSFFSEAGYLLNREVRLLGRARARTTWKARWSDEVSGAWHCFSSRLLATQGTYSGTAEPARENERRVRASVIYMIVAFTLNPSDTALLQGPLARMCSRGKPSLAEILGVLNTMGLSISGRKLQLDASLRICESSAIKMGLLRAIRRAQCPQKLNRHNRH